MLSWHFNIKGNSKYWKNDSLSLTVETTAYALLAYSALKDETNGIAILLWLAKQRNSYGGFVSTQVREEFFPLNVLLLYF